MTDHSHAACGHRHHNHGPASGAQADAPQYTCSMHPEVLRDHPGACPKCGMTLESVVPLQMAEKWTCPMHPEIVRDAPGVCPICGMALEPMMPAAQQKVDPELRNMTRRFWAGVVLSVPLVIIAMRELFMRLWLYKLPDLDWNVIEFLLATPVVIWGGWPFFVRAWQSLVNRSLNMYTLIGLGVSAAYLYSLVTLLIPEAFPASFYMADGLLPVYFEPAAVIIVLVLLGEMLQLRARHSTSAAIRALLD
ncbi:MAG: heavy metal-binding domain-containing protein, partial [Gammaproteobacteria bacterium]